MKIKATYVVSYKNHWEVLYELENGIYFMTTKGGFDQLEYHLQEMDKIIVAQILKANGL